MYLPFQPARTAVGNPAMPQWSSREEGCRSAIWESFARELLGPLCTLGWLYVWRPWQKPPCKLPAFHGTISSALLTRGLLLQLDLCKLVAFFYQICFRWRFTGMLRRGRRGILRRIMPDKNKMEGKDHLLISCQNKPILAEYLCIWNLPRGICFLGGLRGGVWIFLPAIVREGC